MPPAAARPRRRPAAGDWRLAAGGGLFVALLGLSGPALAIAEASLSAERVAAGQTLVLSLRSDGPAALEPDLSPLQPAFHIVDRASGSEVSLVNGVRQQWRTLRLTLLPRQPGRLEVPPLRVGNGTTPALTVTVADTRTTDSRLLPAPAGLVAEPAAAAPVQGVQVTATATPPQVQVGEQVLLVVRVSAATPPRGRLHDPVLTGAQVLPLGEERRVDAGAGGTEQVFERRYALFPQAPGRLLIPPLVFDAWATGAWEPRPGRSPALSVEVAPIPADAPDPWLPARALALTEAGPSAVQLAPGQGLERMVTLRADGLMAEDLPPIALAIPDGLRLGADPPRLWNERRPDGVVGYRVERVLIRAGEPGSYRLKGPRLRWWNTRRGRPQTATLPDWDLTVAPLASAHRRLAPTWVPPAFGPDPDASAAAGPDADSGRRYWLAGLALLGLGAIGVWWRRRRRSRRRRRDARSAALAGAKTPVPLAAAPVRPDQP